MAIEPEPARHHRLLIHLLQRVSDGKLPRLMVFMPPGYAKSTYSSVLFPPFFMGRYPKSKVIAASHTDRFAAKHGGKARNVCSSPAFYEVYEHGLNPRGGTAKNEWSLTNGSEFLSVGVGGGVSGARANLGLIDDPFRSRKDADSVTVRESIWEWYLSDFRSRLLPNAPVIIINTRWHEDDICGRILGEKYTSGSGWFEGEGGEDWFVLSLPAIAEGDDFLNREPGRVLWPEFYTPELVYRERRVQTPRNWASLWQQRPAPEEGDHFKAEWFREYETEPAHLRKYGASDYACSDNEGDYTEHGVIGVDPKDDIYILDWDFMQKETDDWIQSFIELVKKHRPAYWFEEKGQIIKSVGPFLRKEIVSKKAYIHRTQIASTADKVARSQSIRGRFQQRKIYFPSSRSKNWGEWVERLQHQLKTFPNGRYDDGVDVMSLFGLGLLSLQKGSVPKPKKKEPNPLTFNQLTLDEEPEESPYRSIKSRSE